jgi:hypothetical protein
MLFGYFAGDKPLAIDFSNRHSPSSRHDGKGGADVLKVFAVPWDLD